MENRNVGMNSFWRSYRRSEEFHEEDVWNVIKEDREIGFKIDESRALTSPLSVPRRLPSAARMIPRTDRHQVHDSDEPKVVQHSAPVSIPDWSKIYGNYYIPKKEGDSSSISPQDHDRLDHNRYSNDFDIENGAEESDVDEEDWDNGDENGDEDRLPPHEWLAKKLARSQISSFSVCEGAGRTLKGRDLSMVRNAVLSRTGFI